MPVFRTIVNAEESDWKLSYSDAVLFAGSCFSESIGLKLFERKFNTLVNPFGILYNPLSLAQFIKRALSGKQYSGSDLLEYEGKWFSPDHHGSFSDTDAAKCLWKVNQSLARSHDFLNQSRFLFITFGTAWVYEWKRSGCIMANCHKIPATHFNKRLLEVDEICNVYDRLVKDINLRYADKRICFTISPVRHLNDGVQENQYSKSTLLIAVNKLVSKYECCSVFPAYEIMMDDLRDYRFYSDDMLHPSAVAIDYIWEKFKSAWIAPHCVEVMHAVEKLLSAVRHRPLEKGTAEHRNFIKQQLGYIEELKKKYPMLNLDAEAAHFNLQME